MEPDETRDEEWNRGAYIVEGLGHCGACHSKRNQLGATAKNGADADAGGWAEGWYAPPLNDATPAPIPWTQIALVNYLIDGWDKDHGAAAGPMGPVVNDLYDQSEDDVFAIAAYLMSIKGGGLPADEQERIAAAIRWKAETLQWVHPDAPPNPGDAAATSGAAVFERECARCHKVGGEPVPLALSTAVQAPSASNLVMAVFQGVPASRWAPSRSMPGRSLQIADQEMANLATFVRARFSDRSPWQDIGNSIPNARALSD